MKKRMPRFTSDRAAERFLEQDLSDYIHPGNFKPVTFEFAPKNKTVSLRLSEELLGEIKKRAKKRGIPYQRLMREAIEVSIKGTGTRG